MPGGRKPAAWASTALPLLRGLGDSHVGQTTAHTTERVVAVRLFAMRHSRGAQPSTPDAAGNGTLFVCAVSRPRRRSLAWRATGKPALPSPVSATRRRQVPRTGPGTDRLGFASGGLARFYRSAASEAVYRKQRKDLLVTCSAQKLGFVQCCERIGSPGCVQAACDSQPWMATPRRHRARSSDTKRGLLGRAGQGGRGDATLTGAHEHTPADRHAASQARRGSGTHGLKSGCDTTNRPRHTLEGTRRDRFLFGSTPPTGGCRRQPRGPRWHS